MATDLPASGFSPCAETSSVRARMVQGALNVYVEDTGIGIPPAPLARLGRPFEQLDRTLDNGMKGSGLGLAIARKMVGAHGGRLEIESAGSGTTVRFVLPWEATPAPGV